jgi:Flp pilus assembly protein TadD
VSDILLSSLWTLAEADLEVARIGSARRSLERALGVLRSMAEQDPTDVDARRGLRNSSVRLGLLAQQQGKLAEARTAFGSALSFAERPAHGGAIRWPPGALKGRK